jgi:hypothetical protein
LNEPHASTPTAVVACGTLRAAGGDADRKVLGGPSGDAAQAGAKVSKGSTETPSGRAAGIDGIVLTPDGKPAVKAIVALAVRDSGTSIENGAIDRTGDVDCTETDSSGRFHFPPEDSDFYLVITHSTGYAQYKPIAELGIRRWSTTTTASGRQ